MVPSSLNAALSARNGRIWAFVLAVGMVAVAGCATATTDTGSGYDAGMGQETGYNPGTSSSSSGGGIQQGGSSSSSSGGTIQGNSSGGGSGGGDGGCLDTQSCTDFPVNPLVDDAGAAVPNGATLFSNAPDTTAGNAPCLLEPADGALYPYNWLRPRVYWAAATGQKYFEVRFTSAAESNPLVVYTSNNYYALDKGIWQQIAGLVTSGPGTLAGSTLTVSVRGSTGSGNPSAPATATITIAPAIAAGSLIFWTTENYNNSATSTNLQGFNVGDEGTTLALTSLDVTQPVTGNPYNKATGTVDTTQTVTNAQVWCIGCHTATPDGTAVGFTSEWPWSNAVATVTTPTAPGGATPAWMSTTAEWNLAPDKYGTPAQSYYAPPAVDQVAMGVSTFSRSHYATGDHVMIAPVGAAWNAYTFNTGNASDLGFATGVASQLVWLDLEAAGGLPASDLPAAAQTQLVTIPANPAGGGTQGPIQQANSGVGWGTIARTGDTRSAGAPSWSNDGNNIAYASTDYGTKDGRMDCEHMSMTGNTATSCVSDIYVVPYNNKAGGTAKALPGASDSAQNEYYPAWSPDDQLIAFNRVPVNQSMYNTPQAEVWVVPYNGGAGGTAVRLKANDPVACSGLTSPGVQNTWPKWAPNPVSSTRLTDGGVQAGTEPTAQTINGLTYYWVTFSSTRSPTTTSKQQQLYVAGVTMDSSGNIQSYAPIYLWNQDDTYNNLIPSWGTFALPAPSEPPPTPPPFPKTY